MTKKKHYLRKLIKTTFIYAFSWLQGKYRLIKKREKKKLNVPNPRLSTIDNQSKHKIGIKIRRRIKLIKLNCGVE